MATMKTTVSFSSQSAQGEKMLNHQATKSTKPRMALVAFSPILPVFSDEVTREARGLKAGVNRLVPFVSWWLIPLLLGILATGCAPKPPPAPPVPFDPTAFDIIPHQAVLMASGSGKIAFVVPSDGFVYFYDVTSRGVPYSFLVKQGEKVELNEWVPGMTGPLCSVSVDGKAVFTRDQRSQENAFYFLPKDAGPRPPGSH
jgi:hypothetical protein